MALRLIQGPWTPGPYIISLWTPATSVAPAPRTQKQFSAHLGGSRVLKGDLLQRV